MSVDLRSNTLFGRTSLLVTDDALVRLEHGRTQDRVRRFLFDRIDGVVVWRVTPWVRILVCLLCFALPGVALQLAGEPALNVIGYVLIALGVGLTAFYATCRKTTIRLVRNGEPYDIVGIFRPSKVRKLRDKLLPGLAAAHAPTPPAESPILPDAVATV